MIRWTLVGLILGALLLVEPTEAHYPIQPEPKGGHTLPSLHRKLHVHKGHSWGVVKHTRSYRQLVWHRKALRRINRRLAIVHREMRVEKAPHISYWINRQIWAATIIGRESAGDPWPNCPDPFDGGGYTWTDTVRCENGGNWLDSVGFYRCGLQFHPMWERRFGRLCP